MSAPVADKVAIFGGGQLARMLVLAGVPLGIAFHVVDNKADVCAADVAPVTAADWSDEVVLADVARAVDAITFDYENVPADSVRRVQDAAAVRPGVRGLATAQDRLQEKALFESVGLPATRHAAVASRAELEAAIDAVGCPAILKTRRFGYDGKGQFRMHTPDDADAAWRELGGAAAEHGLVLEAMVDFRRELSVLAVRSRDGEFRAWPLVQNWHAEGILSLSLAPAVVTPELTRQAHEHARAVAEALDYVGVFAVELFDTADGLLGNEMAPRVHNSGHWSIEGAVTSQFENHVRAVAGLPLGATEARGTSLMFNWIGELPARDVALEHPHLHWHDYGKDPRPGRKVGHATLCAPDHAELLARARKLAEALGCGERIEQAAKWFEPTR